MKMILPLKTSYRLLLNVITCLFLLAGLYNRTEAQTTLYSENFNSGTSTSWTLNAADAVLGATTTTTKNYWIINNVYAGSSFVNATPDEPAGIVGNPESYYMHITDGGHSHFGIPSPYNASFYAPVSGQTMLTKMNTGIVTTGYTNVTLTFWYVCDGGSANYTGRLYYTTNLGTSWVLAGTYSGVGSWTQVTLTLPAFSGAADLRFGFEWVELGGSTATDPPMSVDDIIVTGTSSASCPLTISNQTSTNPTCHGANDGTITITATNGSGITYTINSGTPQSNSTGIFTGLAPGTYTVSVADTCTTTGTNIVLTDPAAVAAPTATNSGPLCAGDTLKLFATTVAGATYAWTGPNNFAVQNPVKPNSVLADAGVYSVIATVGSCHSTAVTTTVVVNALPATPVAGNNGPLCAGDTLKLTSTTVGGASYAWTGPNTYAVQNPVKANAVLTDSGVYSVVATVGSCHSVAATTHVVINPTPASPTANNNGPLCSGDTLKLTATTVAGATYAWTGPNNYAVQNPVKANTLITDSGTYSVVATVGACHSPAATTRVVISPPPATPVAGNSGPVCQGSVLNITATNTGSSYTWTGPNSFSVQNPTIASTAFTDSGTYTVVAHTGSCSSGPATTHVVVKPSPSAPTPGNNGPLCTGDTLKLTASTVAGVTYSWTGPNNFNTQNPVKASVTATDSGVYTVVVTLGTCSSTPVTTDVVVSPPPATPVAGNNGPVCLGSSLQLTASATGSSYTWTGPNSFSVQNPNIASAALTDSGTYTVVAHVGSCSSGPASTHVVVNPLPASPNASNTGPVCVGTAIQLNATTVAGATYSWTGPNSFSVQNPNIASTTMADSGTYSVVATVAGCNSAPATTLVVINPSPAAPVASNSGPYCLGGTLQLNATTVAGATYSWTGPNSFSTQNPSKPNITLTDSGVYTVVATVAGCNSTGATTTVVIIAPPAVPVATNNGPVCSGQMLQLTAAGNPGYSYSWTGPHNFSTQNPSIAIAALSDSGTYTVVASIGSCAGASGITHVVVKPTPAAPVANNSSPVCAGDTIMLSASGASGATYSWTGPHNYNIQNPGISHASTADTGTYSVIVTVGGCSSSAATTTVVVHATPLAPVITESDSVICSSDSVHICAPATYSSYHWNNSSATGNCIWAKASGNYYVTVSDGNNCSVESNHVRLIVKSAPSVSISENGDTLTCVTTFNCQWYRDGSAITGATGLKYVATQSGLYSVFVTDSNGCSSISSQVHISVGIENISSDFAFTIYPNPATDQLVVEMGSPVHTTSPIEVFDATGRKVMQSVIEGDKTALNIGALSSGMYLLKINTVVRKFVKQ